MQRRFIVLVMVSAFVLSGIGVPTAEEGLLPSLAWAGGGHHDDDEDDDHDGDHRRGHDKDFDHFACYTAASHDVSKDVKIVNQFTKDEYGKIVAIPISVGELTLLCVPTKKILIEDHKGKPSKKPRP
jgi:hypothetical protein